MKMNISSGEGINIIPSLVGMPDQGIAAWTGSLKQENGDFLLPSKFVDVAVLLSCSCSYSSFLLILVLLFFIGCASLKSGGLFSQKVQFFSCFSYRK